MTPIDSRENLPQQQHEGEGDSHRNTRAADTNRKRFQMPLLFAAVTGLAFAGWYSWDTRGDWYRLIDPTYGNPYDRVLARFDLDHATIPVDMIVVGNTSENGIPPLTSPQIVSSAEANFLQHDDRVIGVSINGLSRAYPFKILVYHEAVNDQLNGIPISVTYCPILDSVAVFDRRSSNGLREFAASGLLYNNNVLLYSRSEGEERNLWSQLKVQGVTGSSSGHLLVPIPVEYTTWKDWKDRHPETDVLSLQTGYDRNYNVNPYADYHQDLEETPIIPTEPVAPLDILGDKSRVLGVWNPAEHRAIAFSLQELAQAGGQATTVEKTIGTRKVTIAYNPEAESLRVVRADEGLQWMYAYWFGWYAFFPHTEVYVHSH